MKKSELKQLIREVISEKSELEKLRNQIIDLASKKKLWDVYLVYGEEEDGEIENETDKNQLVIANSKKEAGSIAKENEDEYSNIENVKLINPDEPDDLEKITDLSLEDIKELLKNKIFVYDEGR